MTSKKYAAGLIAATLLIAAGSTAQALEVNVGVNTSVGASANSNSRGQSVVTGVNSSTNASINADDREMRGNATSEERTEMKGNSTSSMAKEEAMEKSDDKNGTSTMSEGDEHKSVVALFVQTLLQSANHMGIGDRVRVVAQDQASSSAKTDKAIAEVEARNGFKTFLVGSDYKNLGTIRSEIVQTRNRLEQLSRELDNEYSVSDKVAVQAEINSLLAEQTKLETYVKTNESKFSLFGWLNKLINK